MLLNHCAPSPVSLSEADRTDINNRLIESIHICWIFTLGCRFNQLHGTKRWEGWVLTTSKAHIPPKICSTHFHPASWPLKFPLFDRGPRKAMVTLSFIEGNCMPFRASISLHVYTTVRGLENPQVAWTSGEFSYLWMKTLFKLNENYYLEGNILLTE